MTNQKIEQLQLIPTDSKNFRVNAKYVTVTENGIKG